MAEKLLTDRTCRTARPKRKLWYLNDGRRLRLQIRPDGAKHWLLRFELDGSENTHYVGTYPETSLEEARRKALEARKLVAEGLSPNVERKLRVGANIARGKDTFAAIAAEWLEHNKTDWSSHHHERNEGLLRRILNPGIGALPIADISEAALLAVLRQAYDSGIRDSARKARQICAQVFRFAKDTHRCTHNPARDLVDSSLLKKPETTHFAALTQAQAGPMLRALEEGDLHPVTKAALLLMLYSGLRDFTLRAARWSEVDPVEKLWRVPHARRKIRAKAAGDFFVPLSDQAMGVLTELARLTHTGPDAYVFATGSKAGFLSENTIRLALHRLGFEVTAHGLRSLITDTLNEREFNADAVERAMDHMVKNPVRRAYLRSDFLELRRPMMQWWAGWLDAQRDGKPDPQLPGSVIQLRPAA